jgi:tripartite-type tricarboxylate transporter receptor subunit TctC
MVVSMNSVFGLFILFVLWAPFGGLVFAQETFFKGKTVRIIVPFAAGGGYDIYSRIMGRHMGKHVPGNPVFVVDNMTGAGGLIGINHVYKIAKPDGLCWCADVFEFASVEF